MLFVVLHVVPVPITATATARSNVSEARRHPCGVQFVNTVWLLERVLSPPALLRLLGRVPGLAEFAQLQLSLLSQDDLQQQKKSKHKLQATLPNYTCMERLRVAYIEFYHQQKQQQRGKQEMGLGGRKRGFEQFQSQQGSAVQEAAGQDREEDHSDTGGQSGDCNDYLQSGAPSAGYHISSSSISSSGSIACSNENSRPAITQVAASKELLAALGSSKNCAMALTSAPAASGDQRSRTRSYETS